MTTAKKEDLEKTSGGAMMQRPAFIEKSTAGTEGITRDDIRLPRLAIAQGLSTQMIPGDSSHIPGLQLFDLFNDLTGQIYGRGPLTFAVGQRQVKFIEFDPDNRGVPLDLEVPPGDPRLKWGKDPVTGKGTPPRATKFVEFVLMLMKPGQTPGSWAPQEPVVLSIQETNKFNKKAHERLSMFISMTPDDPAPIYSKLFTVESGSEKNDKGTFGVPVVRQLGFIQEQALYNATKQFHESLKGKQIVVNRDPNLDPDAFDPAAMERDQSGM